MASQVRTLKPMEQQAAFVAISYKRDCYVEADDNERVATLNRAAAMVNENAPLYGDARDEVESALEMIIDELEPKESIESFTRSNFKTALKYVREKMDANGGRF